MHSFAPIARGHPHRADGDTRATHGVAPTRHRSTTVRTACDRDGLQHGVVPRLVCATFAWAVLACSSSTAPNNNNNGGGGKTTGRGSLAVSVTAPSGVTPSVTVTGPNNYSQTVTATTTLSSLATGTYTVTAGTGLAADSIVSIGYTGSVTGSPATVAAGATAKATVSYVEPWSISGVVWVANQSGNSITGFTSADLATAGTPTPAVTVGNGGSSSAVQSAVAVVIDQTGGMWIADNTDTLDYFKSTQIVHSTNAAPSVRLVSTTLQEAVALALDSHGNLWVADQGTSKLLEFTTTQMAAGGTITPAVVLSPSIGSISRPFDIAFDGHGDLWVANYGDSTVVGFSPSQIATSGRPLPFAGLSGARGTTNCLTMAFDAQGDLWVGTLSDSISEFTPSQLTSIGAPNPAVVLALSPHVVEEIQALAFDNSGALWVLDNQMNHLLRYMPDQLTTSGTPTASVTVDVGAGAFPQWIAFSPHAAGLPLN